MMKFNSIKHTHGFSLLEVLVSVFILAVGLLGLASLQVNSLKNNHSAQYRTTATVLAYDIIDRMRLNRVESYSLTKTKVIPSIPSIPSGSGLKNTDLTEWLTQVDNELPGWQAEIGVNGDIVTVTVYWDDSRAGGSTSQKITVSSER